jgi:NADPH2:quinone reductase
MAATKAPRPREAAAKVAARRTPAIPITMKAATIDRFGPPSVLTARKVPVLKPDAREVPIAIHAAGVGVWDASECDGSWQPFDRPRFLLVLGTDGAGVVVAKRRRATRFRLGDRVWAYDYANPKGGLYAEYAAVKERNVGRGPRHLEMLQAGAGATTGLTALQGIDDKLRPRAGETVLIFEASVAVGTLTVQFVKRRHARVIATATGHDATALVRRLGAAGVIDPRSDDFVKKLRLLVPDGLDAALALAGGDVLEQCVGLVRGGGRIEYPNGAEPELRRRVGIRVCAYDAMADSQEFTLLGRAATEAKLRVPIASCIRRKRRQKRTSELSKVTSSAGSHCMSATEIANDIRLNRTRRQRCRRN